MFLQSVLIVGKYFGFSSIFSFIEVITEANTDYAFVILFVIVVDLGVLTHVCIFHRTQLTLALISSLQFLVHYSFTILPNVRCSSFSIPFHWFELYHLLPVWSVSLIIWVKTCYIKRCLLWNLEVFYAYINQASFGTQDCRKMHKLIVKVVPRVVPSCIDPVWCTWHSHFAQKRAGILYLRIVFTWLLHHNVLYKLKITWDFVPDD